MQAAEANEILTKFGAHPKYGALVTSAVSNWRAYGVRPAAHVWGLAVMESATGGVVYGPRRQDNGCACLVGASLLGRPSFSAAVDAASKEFDLTHEEIWGLVDGFDRNPRGLGKFGYDIGRAISAILHNDTDLPADP